LPIEVPGHGGPFSLLVIFLQPALHLDALALLFDKVLEIRRELRLGDDLLLLLLLLLLHHLLLLLLDGFFRRSHAGSLCFSGDLSGFHLDLVLLQGDSLGLGLPSLRLGHKLVAALVRRVSVLDLQLHDRLTLADLRPLLLDGEALASVGGDGLALLEPLHVDVLASLHCALQHHRLLLLHLLDDRPLPDDGGDLDVEREVGVDLAKLVADHALVHACILGSRVRQLDARFPEVGNLLVDELHHTRLTDCRLLERPHTL